MPPLHDQQRHAVRPRLSVPGDHDRPCPSNLGQARMAQSPAWATATSDPMPLLEGAQVVIQGGLNTYTVTTDARGYYQVVAGSPATDPARRHRHRSQTTRPARPTGRGHHGLVVTTTQNFDLRWLEPCVSVDPTSLDVTVAEGFTTTEKFWISSTTARKGRASPSPRRITALPLAQ